VSGGTTRLILSSGDSFASTWNFRFASQGPRSRRSRLEVHVTGITGTVTSTSSSDRKAAAADALRPGGESWQPRSALLFSYSAPTGERISALHSGLLLKVFFLVQTNLSQNFTLPSCLSSHASDLFLCLRA
jgi:hypothetical protein